MKRSLISVCCLLVAYLSFSQNNSKEYSDLIEKGRSLNRADDYKNAAIAFSSAISLAGNDAPLIDRHRTALSWALANYPDSAFYHLNIIANLKNLSFNDVDDIITDEDYTSILNDKRWQNVKDKMFLTAYKTFLVAQKEAGGKVTTPVRNGVAFARALGNNVDTAFSHLNEAAYLFLRKKMFDKAYKLFKVSINNFPPNSTLYQNMTDYYLAIGDKGRASIYYSRAEVINYNQPAIISNLSLKIDSAIKEEYRNFSKKIGYEVLPPEYLVTTVANALLKKGMAEKTFDLFKMNLENYPYSYMLYQDIGNFYDKKGDKGKANEYFSKSLILQYKLPENFFQPSFNVKNYLSTHYENISKNKRNRVFFSEPFFNSVGNQFLSYKMIDNAELLFKMNVEQYPQSLNVYSMISTYYKTTGEKVKEAEFNKQAQAIKASYRQSGITGNQILPDTTYDIQVTNPACHANCPTILLPALQNGSWSIGHNKPFVNLMANDGFRIIEDNISFTKQSMEKINVAVIDYPFREIKDSEIKSLNDWIRQGGSLLAITHHDYFQIDDFLKSLGVQTQEINITLDSIHGLERDGISIHPAYIVFSEIDKLLGNHPIISGMNNSEKVRLVKTFGGGRSIIGPPGSSVLLRLSESAVDFMSIDPTHPAKSRVPFKSKGLRSFGIAFTLGKGRVVVLSSGILGASLFPPDWGKLGMNNPGSDNRQFALNIMRWLTGYLK